MKIEVGVKVVDSSAGKKLVFAGGEWEDWESPFCIHGIKLRWCCEDCEEIILHRGL